MATRRDENRASQRRTLQELAAAVGDGSVTTRTIRRDLEALEAARLTKPAMPWSENSTQSAVR